jgi:hypothetical protein
VSGPWEDFGGSEGPWADFAPAKADPKIGKPEELTFAEKYIAPVLDKVAGSDTSLGRALSMGGGNLRGSAAGRVMMGAADPGVAIAQVAANAVGAGDAVNQRIQEVEGQYQGARRAAGSEGFDPLRAAGSIAITAPIGAGAGGIAKATAVGAGLGGAQPVHEGDFWTEKAKQVGTGAATGAALAPILRGLARVVSPNASTSADVALLKSEGVRPTLGQAAGGWANTLEERAMSLPIMGDMIRNAREGAREQFNQAAINRATGPIGVKVQGAGTDAIKEAGDALSAAYNRAADRVGHINFDTPAFNQTLGELQYMAQRGLAPQFAEKFDRTLTDVVLRRMSPNGSIAGADLKVVDSELGKIATRYRNSASATEQEFGEAVAQLQANIRDGMRAASPEYKAAKDAADEGWKNLIRVEGAGAKAVNQGGIFTPAQLGSAAKTADKSQRKRATARGTATMQDLADAGQSVIGNRVPDSGTAGRVFMGAGALAAGTMNPAIPAALTAGGLMYTRPVQNALVELLTRRPESAPLVANYLRQLVLPATVGAVPLAAQGRE